MLHHQCRWSRGIRHGQNPCYPFNQYRRVAIGNNAMRFLIPNSILHKWKWWLKQTACLGPLKPTTLAHCPRRHRTRVWHFPLVKHPKKRKEWETRHRYTKATSTLLNKAGPGTCHWSKKKQQRIAHTTLVKAELQQQQSNTKCQCAATHFKDLS